MYWAYSALLALGLLVSLPYWLVQGLRYGKYRAGFGERIGRVGPRLVRQGSQRTVWVHAVSVGEVLAVRGLVGELRRRWPQYRVVVSTTTDTGQRLARSHFGQDAVFYFPLDLGFAIRPYLRRLRPDLIVLVETEFWPNFLRLAGASGARIAVVNARISDRSWPGYRRWRVVLARMLRPVDLFLAQTEQDGKRLVGIGAPADRVQVVGNLKFDGASPASPSIVPSLRAALQQAGARPIIVCGSTVEGEEELLLPAFQSVLAAHGHSVMILAPRHPERFEEVAQLLERSGIRWWRRSQWSDGPVGGGVLLLDSIGELAALYALGDMAFVGGSLVPRGGHNILEPAQQGIPIVVGEHTENFRDVVEFFQSRRALLVVRPAELPFAFMELASNEAQRKELGQRAAAAFAARTGAAERTLKALAGLLEPRAPICEKDNSRATPPQ